MEYESNSPSYRFWPVGSEKELGNESNICRFDGNGEINARIFSCLLHAQDINWSTVGDYVFF